jgi:hypothetical protein
MGGGGKGGGGGGGGDTETTIRYPPYVEEAHQAFLAEMAARRAAAIDVSPYADYPGITDYPDAFFGIGYTISSFPSLYDMYGKFMAGLDVETLFTQILDDSINNVAIGNRVAAHSVELSDDIIANAEPRLAAGLRDINSVISSSFIVARTMLETARLKELSKYDSELRVKMLPVAVQRWSTHLEWNKGVVMTYAEIMKLYFSAAMDINNHNYNIWAKDALWPFTVLDYERAGLGALTGASKTKTDGGPSDSQSAIGGALTGAAAGYMVGGPVGAVIGGALGFASSFF